MPRVFLDFRMTLEFRVLTDDTDAGVVIRTWTGKGGWPTSGYRVGLPRIGQPDPASVLIARKAESRLLISGLVEPRPTGEWQFLQINGEGRRVSVFLNRTRVGVFEVEHFGGHVLFEARKGAVQLRNVVVTPTDPIADLSAWSVPTPGTKAAQVLHEVKPRYTFEAMERRVTGVVEVEAVVLEDGTVGPARALRTLDPDLDLCALAAVKAWRFQPAVRDGKPVATKVFIELTYTLKERSATIRLSGRHEPYLQWPSPIPLPYRPPADHTGITTEPQGTQKENPCVCTNKFLWTSVSLW